MKRVILVLAILFLFVYTPVVHAQSLDIPIKGYGISFGNSKNFTGLRFNIWDKDVEQINGLNLAIASGGKGAAINGLFLGVASGGEAATVNGISLGFLSGGKEATINGISFAWISFIDNIKGISITGYGGGAKNIKGIGIGLVGYSVEEETNGILIGGVLTLGGVVNGVSVGGFNLAAKELNGVQIGLFNFAEKLNGIQIGLVNYAGNNSPGLQWLPIFNANFSF
jgi:hypothetical protein